MALCREGLDWDTVNRLHEKGLHLLAILTLIRDIPNACAVRATSLSEPIGRIQT